MKLNLSMNFNTIFTQTDNIVTVNYLNIETTFKMPDYFNIEDVSDDLKALSLLLLYYPHDKTLIDYKFTRKSAGDKIGLAFSGGSDSVAASALLPKDKTVLFHHKRIIKTPSLYKHDNPMYVISKTNQPVLIIDSTLEEIRTSYQAETKRVGFSNDYSFFAGFLLLADYLNIGYLSSGMVFDSSYLKNGNIFRDFHNLPYFKKWFNLFERANLPLFFPCIPCSKVLVYKILETNNLVAETCIRGENGNRCDNCPKCFTTNLYKGLIDVIKSNPRAVTQMRDRPLIMAGLYTYSVNKHDINMPELMDVKGVDVNWLEHYFEYTLQSIPEEYREYLKKELNKYTTMCPDVNKLKTFKLTH